MNRGPSDVEVRRSVLLTSPPPPSIRRSWDGGADRQQRRPVDGVLGALEVLEHVLDPNRQSPVPVLNYPAGAVGYPAGDLVRRVLAARCGAPHRRQPDALCHRRLALTKLDRFTSSVDGRTVAVVNFQGVPWANGFGYRVPEFECPACHRTHQVNPFDLAPRWIAAVRAGLRYVYIGG